MSEAKHTPGPWTWDESNSVAAAEDVAIANLEGDPEFWGVGFTNPDESTRQANGRLIAAAPDMLKELEETASWLDERAAILLDQVDKFVGQVRRQWLRDEAARLKGRAVLIRQTILKAK